MRPSPFTQLFVAGPITLELLERIGTNYRGMYQISCCLYDFNCVHTIRYIVLQINTHASLQFLLLSRFVLESLKQGKQMIPHFEAQVVDSIMCQR